MVPSTLAKSFEDTLLAGGYNLLVGSGISLDSRNGNGEPLRSADQLRRDLCSLTGARDTTTLTRAYALLNKLAGRRSTTGHAIAWFVRQETVAPHTGTRAGNPARPYATVIIRQKRLHMPVQRGFIEDNQVIQTLSAHRANHVFDESSLPGEGLPWLLGSPFRCGMGGDVEIHDLPSAREPARGIRTGSESGLSAQ
jgi:hypothetical protein